MDIALVVPPVCVAR